MTLAAVRLVRGSPSQTSWAEWGQGQLCLGQLAPFIALHKDKPLSHKRNELKRCLKVEKKVMKKEAKQKQLVRNNQTRPLLWPPTTPLTTLWCQGRGPGPKPIRKTDSQAVHQLKVNWADLYPHMLCADISLPHVIQEYSYL